MRRITAVLTILALSIISPLSLIVSEANAAAVQNWNAGYIMADSVFTNSSSMTFDNIQAFLNSKVPVCDTNGTQTSEFGGGTRAQWAVAHGYSAPFTCLKDYTENGMTAAQIIFNASRQYQINPQVLLVLLQKEQGLVTDTWPTSNQYKSATGYGCPDSTPGVCNSSYYGFTNQINNSARMFHSIMVQNPNWYSPYSLGNNTILWNPNSSTCGNSTVNIQNLSTVALYDYTPYQPNQAALNAGYGTGDGCSSYGNRNFYLYFSDWFGSPRGDYCISSLTASVSSVIFGKTQQGGPDLGQFVIDSGASTNCVEFHTWSQGMGTWLSHIPSNSSSINLADSKIMYADLDGSGKDVPVLVAYRNTGSGRIEFHVWDSSLKSWSAHYISNAATIDPAVSSIYFADLDGSGKDSAILAGIAPGGSGSGNIEFHVWNPGFGSWKAHYISNAPVINPAVSQISFADLDGNGTDEGILAGIAPGGSGSGNIEFHVWNPGFGSWKAHYISNAPVINPAVSQISFADLDGNGTDEGILIGLRGAGTGSGNIEVHVWNSGFGTWKTHIITNQTGN